MSEPDDGPLVERVRSPRRRIVTGRGLVTVAAVVVLLALIAGGSWWYATGMRVTVPDLLGVSEGVARTQLAREGLDISSVERRFDESPAGTVLSQDPVEGTVVSRGSGVALVVSAGTEEFAMPDVTGLNINVARGQLEQRGLVVRIEAVPSDEVTGTVLETVPAPGVTVRTAEIVRVKIAAEGTASAALLPFALEGRVFVIDPVPSATGEVDAPLEVSRRLRSLLEASGARVMVTRSVTETDVAEAVRVERTAEATGTVSAVISLEVRAEAPGGLGITSLGDLPAASPASLFADELARTLAEGDRPVLRTTVVTDPILDAVSAPGARIRLGSLAVPEDVAAFRDPAWSDTVARAIYRAIGERFSPQ